MRGVKWAAVLAAVVVAGCAAQPTYTVQRAAGELPVGTRLEVSTPFTYPADRTSLWFQSGEIKDSRRLNVWDWHCSLDLHVSELSNRSRSFTDGAFLVTGLREERLDQLFGWETDYTLGVVIALSAPDYPAVRQLRCERRFTDWTRERPLALADLRAAVGGYLTVGATSR